MAASGRGTLDLSRSGGEEGEEMSAIISGKCEKCGEDFYYSFGHPKWFDERKGQKWDNFVALVKAPVKVCANCGSKEWGTFMPGLVAVREAQKNS